MKFLLFDLDETLLRSDKTFSPRTLEALRQCREKGVLIGVSTSRAEHNCLDFLPVLQPDILIASGGAVIKHHNAYIFTAEFSPVETRSIIDSARAIFGEDYQITLDTLDGHYWNYKVDPTIDDPTWGKPIHTDYSDFTGGALKLCVQILDLSMADAFAATLPECDFRRFSGSPWHKITKKNVTKESAVRFACDHFGIDLKDTAAFGDDTPDIGMLQLCGTGVAMGNAVEAVKAAADIVIGTNDEDGIAKFLEEYYQFSL